jgi:hypothetical protein
MPGIVRHPVDLAQPDRAVFRVQRSALPPADLVKLCARSVAW